MDVPSREQAPEATSERVRRIMDQIARMAEREAPATFSTQAYADEPILRTGADLARSQRHKRAPGSGARGTHAAGVARAYKAPAQEAIWQDRAGRAGRPDAPSAGMRSPASGRQDAPAIELPPELARLRDLEREQAARSGEGDEGADFVEQARLVEGFADDYGWHGHAPWRRPKGYQALSDGELRAYFSWRAAWRGGGHGEAPPAFAVLLAYELINGIGTEPGPDALAGLEALADACEEGSDALWDLGAAWNVRTWARDYALTHGIVSQGPEGARQASFSRAISCLRRAERAVVAQAGLRGLSPADIHAPAPTDEEVLSALCEASTFKAERSPFVREHRESFAAVAAAVFRDLALHCARRRKVLLVDNLVGQAETLPFVPFAGVPLPHGWEGPDRSMALGPGTWVRLTRGEWRRHRPWQAMRKSKDLTRLLRAIDRQMRLDWEFGHPLKEVGVPKYQAKFVEGRSAERRQAELERERRRFTVDTSKLASIRSAAAITREALLVDEEREGWEEPVPDAALEPEPSAILAGEAPHGGQTEAPAAAGMPPSQDGGARQAGSTSPDADGRPAPGPDPEPLKAPAIPPEAGDGPGAGAPFGLTSPERALLDALLSGAAAPAQAPGAPSADMLVDSINEKLFDLVGDVVIEFDDAGAPALVEDYEQDVRGAIGS